jgi:hypothetical protein
VVYPYLITATGWTWEYIDDHMTLPRWNHLAEYWSQYPPTNILVGAALGNKTPPRLVIRVDSDLPVREFMAKRADVEMSGAFAAIAASMPGMMMVKIPKGGKTLSGIPVDEI